jgi:L-ascorbate metabolism protein UlaG (beta-lactamase superfamily)
MKITKYPQSCLIIENNNKRIIIDPGSFVSPKFSVEALLPVDAILITHEHQDHADPNLINELIRDKKIPVIANDSAQAVLGDCITKVVRDNETFEIEGFKITARELPHMDMVDGTKGPKNTGFVIDDIFFHPGDGIEINNLQVETAAVPLAGPDLSPKDVYGFIKELNVQTVIPIHYDAFPADPNFYQKMFQRMNLNTKFIILENGSSAEV